MVLNERMEDKISQVWRDQEKMLSWNGSWISANQFWEQVDRLTQILRQAGFQEGDRVATLLPVCPAYLMISVAVWKLGGAVMPMNMGATAAALSAGIKAAAPAVVFQMVGDEKREDYEKFGIAVTPITPEGVVTESVRLQRSFSTPKELAVIFFTSGTTGRPKGVPLTHSNLLANINTSLAHALPPESSDEIMFNVLPNFHALGCVISGYLPLVVGYAQVLHPNFLPVSGTLQALSQTKATVAVVVPTMLHFISGVALKTGWKSEHLKLIICGGDRLSPELAQRVDEGLPFRLVEGYGLTEASPVLAVTRYDRKPRMGTVGQLYDNVEYRLTDREGTVVDGPEGVLWVRGPSIIKAYLGNEAETKDRFDQDWLNTGDLVRIDEDRTVTILERVSDLIIVGGFNVYPQEVEMVLMSHPAVAQAGVVGLNQTVSGQVIRGYVALKEGQSVQDGELVRWCAARLPHFKQPRRVEVLPQLPVNALGKVMRAKLRELATKEN